MLPYIIKEKLFMALVLYNKEMKAFDQNPLKAFTMDLLVKLKKNFTLKI